MDALLEKVIQAHGGCSRWNEINEIVCDVAIGGPIWTAKGWQGTLDDVTCTVTPREERTVFERFTAPDLRSTFETNPETVTIENLSGERIAKLTNARAAFKGFLRATPWERTHLGYFLGYAFWNYLTTPFLLAHPDVECHEIEPWRESGQTWRRLAVTFPESISTHNPAQIFYFDQDGLQRRMDYVTEVLGSTLVAHYTSRHKDFGGITFPTRRRVFRRNPDNTSNLNMPSITLDIKSVVLR
ncbi:hypothetical protein [Streptomyces sp. NPDC090080]|uniref:hypothetical protein n=1 Tax=Streptomyces sp. NPDC090080 TaxID=3365939 RepID=UPI003800EC6D